jgi:hypothetical protein
MSRKIAAATATAWKTIPSWYLLTRDDKAITLDAKRFMANRAHSTIVEVKSSHSAMISHVDDVTNIIEKAPKALD